MDYLINKSDSTIVQRWGGTIAKLTLPEQTGGDVTFTGDKRPLDLGDYVLVKAVEVDEALDAATEKRGETTTVVSGETVTVTRTTVAKTTSEVASEELNRLERLETPRRLAESVLTAEGKSWLQDNRNLIELERAKL